MRKQEWKRKSLKNKQKRIKEQTTNIKEKIRFRLVWT